MLCKHLMRFHVFVYDIYVLFRMRVCYVSMVRIMCKRVCMCVLLCMLFVRFRVLGFGMF